MSSGPQPTRPEPFRHLVNDLWVRVRRVFSRAIAAIGSLSALAAATELSRVRRRDTVRWIVLLEHIVRRLLLAHAAALAPVLSGAAPKRGSIASNAHQGVTPPVIDISNPETWSARFSLAVPHDEHRVPESRAPRIRALWNDGRRSPPPSSPRTPRGADPSQTGFRLARRLEALRRVLQNPKPYAERLNKIMRRAVRRFPEIVQRYAYAGARTNFYDPEDSRLGIDVYSLVVPAPRCFESNTS